ncbi:hypothetical protein A6037_00750 [[Haemophilus] ducreyi]|uniref:YopT-type cysteine protease domain-containing protein n=1 Tax=Haemophilus ducreyi TaxID=730 RepID=UPI0007CDC24C|nr:YopT-type cysteine protease domain-containing protein [[Haemophilus] ducreyi]ANF61402.1 hypothetical protein A6037_00750 [[Haemophilus] ducreyi]
MNNKRYKLIFSKVKNCLVPVAENIKSASGNSSSSSNSKIAEDQEEESDPLTCSLSPLSSSIHLGLHNHSPLKVFKGKNLSVVLLSLMPAMPLLAQQNYAEVLNGKVSVDSQHSSTRIYEQKTKDNSKDGIVVVEIANPEADGVSDNRFKNFNIPNSAVFNNSRTESTSQLVGKLHANTQLQKEAKLILNQVTGINESNIQGALEVAGKKADLIIVNPNGITLNGVKTINADRFVVSTAKVSPYRESGILSVEKGKVTIGKEGVATNGLSHFEVVAKEIDQKGKVTVEKLTNDQYVKPANITFAAGNLDYNLTTRGVTATSRTYYNSNRNNTAISGDSVGSMYGSNIKFILTDKGAGVNHQGVIFAEDDINILTNEGDSKLNKIHADYVRVVGKDIELADKGLLFGKEQLILNTTGNIKLKNASSVISNKNLGIKAANITLDNATVSADNLSFRIKNDAKLSNSSKVSALVADVKSGNLALDNSSLSVNKLTLNITKDVMLNKASKLSAKEIALNVTNNITLNGTSKLSAGKANIKTANLTLNGDNSSLVAEKLDINATNKITNNGTIAGITANITTNALENKKDAVILAHKNLNFTVNGSDYVNKGDIISKDKATLTFSNNSDFISNGSKLVDAQNNLTVNVNNFNISQKGDEITLHGKVKLNVKGNFTNHGNLITVQELDIGEVQNFTNTGNLTVGKNLDIHSNTAVKNDGKLVTIETLNISSKTDFFNNGTMIGLEALKIASGGNFTNASNGTLASNKTLDIGGNNFTNNGTIESVKSLNITNNGTFINNATIQSYGVLNITTTGNFTNESNGTVMSHRVLNITAQQDNITNKNLIAGGAGLNLTAVKGNISNKSEKNTAVLHSLGNIMLDANNTVYNLGEIYSQAGNITFDAQKLHNDVKLSGQVGVKLKNGSAEVKSDSYNPGSFLTSFQHPSLEIVGNFADLDNSLKIDSRGKIYAGNSLNFKKKNGGNGNIINRGTINVINKLSYDSGVNVENNMVSENVDLYQKIFKADNTIKLEIKGNNSVTFRDNPKQHKSGSTLKTKEFKNLEELISAAFDGYNGSAIEEATIPTPYYLIALAQAVNNTNGEGYLKTALQYIFGQNWQDLLSTDQNRLAQINHKWNELKTKWNKFKENGNKTAIKLNLYPTDNGVEKAKVFAGVLENSVVNGQEYEKLNNEAKEKYKDKYKKKFQSVFKKFIDTNEDFKGRFQNGEFDWAGEWAKDDKEKGNYDSTKANEKYESIKKEGHTVNIGKHEIKVPGVSFENLNNINHQQDKSDGIDKSIISELLAQPIYTEKSAARDNDPRVDQNDKEVLDNLYRTRLSYINQDNYLGAKYFFKQLGSEGDKLKAVKRVGDNYFEHQVITRLIEKLADNHLTLKHGLNDVKLVQKLVDAASKQAKDLNLKVGEALTKEQKDNLKEDIVWYVKTEVNGQEVLVPQVYLAKQTIEEVEKHRGVGTGQIRAGIIDVKVDDVRNTGTIAGYAVGLEAKNKLKNTGDILSERISKLVGKKGIESTGVLYVDENGDTKVRKARMISEGHLYLESDKDSNVDLTVSEVKGKTGQIKTKNLNLNNTYETSYKYQYEKLFGKEGGEIGDRVTQTSQAKSVGTDASFDHLHLSIEGNVNQTGSSLKTNRTTGIVKGDFNTKAGKDLFHRQIDTVTSGTVYSASASGGGQSVGFSLADGELETYQNKTSTTGANVDVTNFVKTTKETETSVTHRNSEFDALSGELYVIGKADIGGVDINKDIEVIKTPEEIAAEHKAAEEAKKAKENETSETGVKETEKIENDNVAEKDKSKQKFKKLTDEEIAAAFETKGEGFFAAYKAREEEDRKKGFTLSAEQIESTKARDEKETTYYEQTVGIGAEAEAHSAIADAVSNKARQIADTQNGVKQDGTVALQEASDALNLATGDLVGASAKFKVELSTTEKKSRGASDGRSILGGRLNLIARGGDITLNNVETTENSYLSLKARDNVNVNSGVTEQKDESNSQSLKLTAGASSGCGVMAGGCSAGVSAGVSGSYNESNTESTSHTNSLLRGKSLRVEAGRDFNLIGSNVDVEDLHLDVKGDTNVVSKQDTYSRKERGVNYSVSGGVGVSTAGGVRPNGSVGLGVSAENEDSKIIKQQAGISAKRITGEINNLNLTGGYIENKGNPDELNVKGNITTNELKDEHHKDGGSFGGSFGVSETGVTQVNVNGGRVEQKHYEATQHSSISGINTKGKTVGNFKTDRSQSTEVHRDDTIAATNFNFELGDIAELAKKGKEKWDNRSAKTADNDAGVDSPRLIKGEAEKAQTLGLTKAGGNDVIPEIQLLTQKARLQSLVDDSPYTEIPALTRPQVKSNLEQPVVELLQARARVLSDVDESPYAEITLPTSKIAPIAQGTEEVSSAPLVQRSRSESESGYEDPASLGLGLRSFKSSPKGEYEDISDVIEPQTRTRKPGEPEPIYGTVNKSPEAIVRANAKADEAIQALGYDPRIKPVVPEEAPPALPPRNLQTKAINDYDDVSYVPDFKVRKTDEPEPIYGTINKSPEAIVRANAKADEAIQALGYDPRVKPVVPEEAPPALPPRPQSLDIADAPSYRSRLADSEYSEQPRTHHSKRAALEEPVSETFQPRSRRSLEEDGGLERLPLHIIDNGSDYAEILPRVKQADEPVAQAIRVPKALESDDGFTASQSFKSRKAQLDEGVENISGIYSSIKPKALIEENTPIARQVKTVQDETPITDLVNKRELVKEGRSLLDKVQDTFQPLKVKSKINDVRSSVEEYGGEVTFKYAQSKGEVYNEIVKHAETQNGVCEATCSHWIAKKVNDENIWTDLYKDGQKGRKGGLNKDAIESIEKLQTEFINAGTATQQFKLTNTWLEEQGVVPKQKYFGKLSRADEVAGTVSKNDISTLVKAILDTGNESSAVKKISINLEGGSHTVSASIEGQKVVFFDPNFGEITFKDKKSFEKWMKNAFWKKSGYAGKKDTKRFFNVVNYHKNSKRNKVIDVNHIQQLTAPEGFSPSLPTRPQLANAAGIKSNETGSLFSWSKLKHLFSKDSGKKAQVESSEIKHLGGAVDKDAFYFPLDKIVMRRDAEGEIRVNMDNIKKAFNPRDKHYNSQEARSLRSLYNQDPSMSGTRFIIENQVIANPFSSAELQSYIQAQQSKLPELGRQARRALPELPTAANKGRGARVEEQNIVTRPRVEDVYATVNKGANRRNKVEPDGFYTEKLAKQVSQVPTTEPVYADLQFNRNGKVVRQSEPEVIYERIKGQQVEVDDPSSLYAKVNRNRRLDNVEGFYTPEQLRTRSDKLAEQVSRVSTTEPVYADLRFKSAEDDYAPALPARPELGNAAGFRKAKVKGEESESTWSRLKHLFSRDSGKKAQVESSEIKHLGGAVDKDAFYFPLDKIVMRRDAEGEIRVNMDNIKKAFNPRDKHYNSQEARSLRSLYNQDPSMSGTRFIIENQVIANPFSSAELQSYIQAQQSKLPELGRQARRALPELPTAANKGRGARVEEQNIVTRPRVEDVYATVNKGANRRNKVEPDGFYTEKLAKQVSQVPTTEPVYADLQFNRNGKVVRQSEPEVIYERIKGQQVEVDDPSSLYAKVNRNRRLDNVEGFYTPEQLRTRSDKLAEQVSRVSTTEPVYADLRFKSAEDDYAPALPARPELGNAAGFRKAKVKGEESESTWSRLKHLFSRDSGKKAQVESSEIKHLGGAVDKDAFYFPLDKIVMRRDAEGEIRVNMDNIKKAFNPRDKHYNSQEARSLRSLYNQDPSMSGTRFIIENQVIANPFSSAELQSYIQAQQSKLPELGRQARRALPELPTAANKGRGARVEEQNIVTRPRVEDVYATVNKGANRRNKVEPDGFYTEKLAKQVSQVPTTEPVYADLQFNRNGKVVRQSEPEVIYERIKGQQVEVDDPSSLYAKVNRNRRLDNVEGFYTPEQLRTRSDKLAEQVSRVSTTEPVYADLRFKSAEDDYAPALPARPELGNAAGFRKAKVKGEESESTWSRLKHLFSRDSNKTKVEEVENEYKSQTNGENSLEIKTIEHIPTRLKNLESPREAQSDLGENALIYGLQRGRQALISKANAADKEGKNAILADSYIGKLNLGFEFGELTKFAKQVKDGKVTEQDIQDIASFNDETAKLARRSEPKNRINDANVDDNQRIIRELINNEAAVDALKRIATLSDQEKAMHSTLRANEKFDMDELEESPNYTTAENKSIRDYKDTQKALNDARMDFFTEKTKFIAKETLERGGQLYFALDGLVTNSPGFRADTQINMDKLKDVFNPNHEHYDSVTSRELRYLYENYKDNPNLKFTLKDHVIANPLKTLKTSISESDLKSSPRRARQEGPSLLQRVRNLFDKSSSNKRSEKDTEQTSVGYRNTNIDIINDKTKGVNHIVENGVEVALTNTDYKPLKLPNVEAAFKQTKLKAENIDPHIEAVKKLEIIASSANSIPKEHLLKALIEVTEGKTDEDINVYQKLFNTRQNISNEVAPTYSLRNLDGKDGKQILRSVAEIYKNLPLSDTYQAVRNYVNNRLIEKLSSNRLLLEHLANSKISGNEYAIKYIFDTVSRAKQEIFEQELNTELAPVSLDIMRRKAANILSSEHGSYKDGMLSIYDKPVKSAFHSRLKNNGEVLNTIVHELTHHEQDALAKIIDNKGYDAKLFDKNNILYITGGLGYPKQALERDAFLSGDSVSEAFMKKAKEYHERTKQERKDAKKDEARIAKLYKQWEQEEANKKSASLNGSSQSLDSRSEVEFNRVSHKSVR